MSQNAWLILANATAMRGTQINSLLQHFGDIDNVVAASTADLVAAGVSQAVAGKIARPDMRQLELCEHWLSVKDQRAIHWNDAQYPPLLKEISDPPALLFVRGDANVLTLPQFAIVGSRNATASGCETARQFASHLSASGFCIVSGLAAGIDAAAHRGALDTNNSTVAVLGTGPDQVYPTRHATLADAIAANGALVSEFPPGTPPRRAQFPQRNRLISGMSVGTLVVEAGLRSGALITARLAAEQGREVFAMPGSIHNPTARGCHQLIRSGAKLVETAGDIIEELSGMLAEISRSVEQNKLVATDRPPPEVDPDYQRLLELMGWDPTKVDTLVSRSGLTAEEVSSMLLILELDGRVEPLTGGCYIQREERPLDERNRA
ncbi:MAG: DNA-processing protein DprA [Gammaproteobacteria bacterium]|nr:DNA-processing protein DprA [Gammaproteobacteria bacterium]